MNCRERYQAFEAQFLSPYAQLSARSRGRVREEPECSIRTPYQRDRDRIIHCKAFRRLKRKTQVFLSPLGDHYRTRLTHTLEVAQIARTISRALRLNEDLAEAIVMGHDLGHTPFGHVGEAVLDQLLPEGFRHYEQSLRVVERLENDGRGLNLTWEVRDGILKHSKGMGAIFSSNPEKVPATLEGQVVRVSDIIAYINHDLDDALRAGLIGWQDVPAHILTELGQTHSQRINTLVRDVIEQSQEPDTGAIGMSAGCLEMMMSLRQFLHQEVYRHPQPRKELNKARKLMEDLFAYLVAHPETTLSQQICRMESAERAAADFLAGMTDHFAIDLYRRLFIPQEWTCQTEHGLATEP